MKPEMPTNQNGEDFQSDESKKLSRELDQIANGNNANENDEEMDEGDGAEASEKELQSQESGTLHNEFERKQKFESVRGGLIDVFGKYEVWGEAEGLLNNLENGSLNATDFVSKLFDLNNKLEIEENIKELNRGTIREISKILQSKRERAA